MGKLADSAFPGIVDVVEQEEERFLIMEWIEGETLAAQMERDGAFAEETVIEIGICLAKAIQKLHQMQPPLLYLDCKPSNVMKDSDGKIRLIDFGSALEAHTPVTKGISASPGYAAPEQLSREIEKRCVDVRTDVFGLGRTLYALLCGADLSRPPYAFASLKSRCPQVSDELEQIIMRATAREPEARFQTMEAFLQVLLALQEAYTVDDTGKKAPFWQKVRRKKTADCEVLQSVLRTAAGVDRAAGKIPITLRDGSLRKLLIKENAALYTEKPVFLELNPNTLGCGDEVRVMLSLYSRNEKIGEYELVMGQKR